MKTRLRILAMLTALLVALAFGVSCSDDETGTGGNGGTNTGTNAGNADGGDLDAGANNGTTANNTTSGANNANADAGPPLDANSPFDVNDAGQVDCGGTPCACDNGIDDDGDGLVDGLDPECTGPYDNDEGTFATGIAGDNKDPKWQDCFFDGNSGAGDDKCRYRTECLTGDLPMDDPDCQTSAACLEFCRPLTPNGCDCFGCCEVFRDDGTSVNIIIGGECSLAELDNPEVCTQCQRTDACVNTCGECELCLGKTIDDLPDSCFNGGGGNDAGGGGDDAGGGGGDSGNPGGGPTCDDGEPVCQQQSDCANGFYCQLGCCLPIIL